MYIKFILKEIADTNSSIVEDEMIFYGETRCSPEIIIIFNSVYPTISTKKSHQCACSNILGNLHKITLHLLLFKVTQKIIKSNSEIEILFCFVRIGNCLIKWRDVM